MSKDKALEVLTSDLKKSMRFNALLPLLGNAINPPLFRHYNKTGYSAPNLRGLEYDVKKAYGIKSKDLKSYKKPKLEVVKADTLPEGDNAPLDEAQIIELFKTSDDAVKKEVKLRERYPFLNAPDCNPKFYTLVGLNGTAYNEMVLARKELMEQVFGDTPTLTEEALFALAAKAVENFEMNVIGNEELDYFKEHGEILGNHPIFEEEVLQRKVNSFSESTLASKLTNLKNYIGKNLKKLADQDASAKAKTIATIRKWEQELQLVEERLKMPTEKRYVSKLPA